MSEFSVSNIYFSETIFKFNLLILPHGNYTNVRKPFLERKEKTRERGVGENVRFLF